MMVDEHGGPPLLAHLSFIFLTLPPPGLICGACSYRLAFDGDRLPQGGMYDGLFVLPALADAGALNGCVLSYIQTVEQCRSCH